MELEIKGKIALVTGSSSGMGKSCAKALADEGASVIICSRSEDNLKKAQKETGAIDYVVANLSSKKDIERLYKEVKEKHGTIDILVNNTGGPPAGSVFDIEDHQWIENFENTVMSVIRLTKLVLPKMKKQKFGRIINMTSTSVKQPIPNLLLSNTLRPGVVGFAKTVSDEVAPFNITINNVCPGTVNTEHLRELAVSWGEKDNLTKNEMIKKLEKNAPVNRLGEPEEIASVVAFLASEKASFITGTTIQVDGGRIRSIF